MRRFALSTQFAGLSVAFLVILITVVVSMKKLHLLKQISFYVWCWVWSLSAAGATTAVSIIDESYYPIAVPVMTIGMKFIFLRVSNLFLPHTGELAAINGYFFSLGIVAGMNFTSFLVCSDYNELIVTTIVTNILEVVLNLKPVYTVSKGYPISASEILHHKVVVYTEYLAALLYAVYMISDFSPLGAMVETSVDGCYGYPLATEFRERYMSVFFLIGGEFLSDWGSYLIAQKLWNAGNVTSPLVLTDWKHTLIMMGVALLGGLLSLEGAAALFKKSVSGGII